MTEYLACYIDCRIPADTEIALALLGDLPFEAFQEEGACLTAWADRSLWNEEAETLLRDICSYHGWTYTQELIEPVNWNEEWERNFEVVEVPPVCLVRAPFHTPREGFDYEVIIHPRMAFGTGHHETTYMMISAMGGMDFTGKSVFDYGCGTGILAILARKMGAGEVSGIDIEGPAIDNSRENAVLNGLTGEEIMFLQADLSGYVPERSPDIVLANIQLNVLVESCNSLYDLMPAGALLLTSGVLSDQEERLCEVYAAGGFELLRADRRGNWVCHLFCRR